MQIKVSDYIVDFLIKKGITDVFGYPGGMVTHLMESFRRREDEIQAHVNYHEQASAFCACGYAQISGLPGVAYATSGPGATNLITGICNAYFDSIPAIFITGQVNTFESKGGLPIRQKGFQETDIISMVGGVTKYCSYVEEADRIRVELEKAWYWATEGRKGPVLLDIPMNIFRSMVDPDKLPGYCPEAAIPWERISAAFREARRPVILLGAGNKQGNVRDQIRRFSSCCNVPIVTSMPAFDLLESSDPNAYGFIGAYGDRTANFLLAKCDLLLAVGTRLDIRQIGARKENFAPEAKLIRVDIDAGELSNPVKGEELQIRADAGTFWQGLLERKDAFKASDEWVKVCTTLREKLQGLDQKTPNDIIRSFSQVIPDNVIVTT
ncbi:MAG: thiamine pyrophosphate-binding protein, partial [Lachnospiraceae bacterium]|nr:thiamine pyrophosphate-binding protein [Lachnospiraceae bacterium]